MTMGAVSVSVSDGQIQSAKPRYKSYFLVEEIHDHWHVHSKARLANHSTRTSAATLEKKGQLERRGLYLRVQGIALSSDLLEIDFSPCYYYGVSTTDNTVPKRFFDRYIFVIFLREPSM